ncbi:hypothetical protein C8J57DRAFT_1277994 [Mycena rebaudengoi]|nr:hypothetical protein C8J57DRAFT_1277994 [Mycena rebaudengoi]
MEAQIDRLERKAPNLTAEEWSTLARNKIVESNHLYRQHMAALTSPASHPRYQELEPVSYKREILYSYLATDSNSKRFLNHVLYLPKRTRPSVKSHVLAFGPTHRYDQSANDWIMGSDLDTLHGGTRELFMDCNHWVMYAGTYKCHDLREVYPEGTPSQQGITAKKYATRP